MLVYLTADLFKCVISPADGVRWKAWLLDVGSSDTFVEMGSVRAQERALSALLFSPFGQGELASDMNGIQIRIEDFKNVRKIVSENELDDMWNDIGDVYHPSQDTLAVSYP
jgi:hypothetical protein